MKTVQFQNVHTVRTWELKLLCAYVGIRIPRKYIAPTFQNDIPLFTTINQCRYKKSI